MDLLSLIIITLIFSKEYWQNVITSSTWGPKPPVEVLFSYIESPDMVLDKIDKYIY